VEWLCKNRQASCKFELDNSTTLSASRCQAGQYCGILSFLRFVLPRNLQKGLLSDGPPEYPFVFGFGYRRLVKLSLQFTKYRFMECYIIVPLLPQDY